MNIIVLTIYLMVFYIRPAEWIPGMEFRWLFYTGVVSIFIILVKIFTNFNEFANEKVGIYILYFTLWCVISKGLTGWWGGGEVVFFKLLPIIVIYYLIIFSINTPSKLNYIFFLLSILTCFLSIHAIIQMRTGIGFGGIEVFLRNDTQIQTRWFGVFHDPNDLGLAFVVVIPYIFHRALDNNPLYLFFLILIIGGVYSTNSRGTFLAMLFGIAIYFLLKKKNIKGILISGVIIGLLISMGPSRFTEISATETSAFGRIEAWYHGLKMLGDSFLIGVGVGNFTEYHPLTAHNSFVLAAAETGILGLILFSGIVLTPVLVGSLIILNDMENNDIGLISAVVAGGVAGIISISFLSRTYIVIPYMMTALQQVVYRIYCGKFITKYDFFYSWRATFLLGLGVFLSLYIFITFIL